VKKIVCSLLSILILFNAGLINNIGADTLVDIPDVNFRKLLIQHLGLSPDDDIKMEHMKSITYLSVGFNYSSPNPINNIEGIQYATFMSFFQIGNHPVSDISPLE